ncbi:MAG: serine/threonine protein kinase, partial [Xanthomonadales bacterium]|nr:serine/threonine protein kinase [Xanthomonadales bacterium]
MTIDWKRALALFEEVAELDAGSRTQRMSRLGAEDPPLAAQVQALLDAHARSVEGALPARIEAELIVEESIGDEQAGLHAGATIGGYRLLEPVGRGGMASVWLAEHDHAGLRRRFALKLPYPVHARRGLAERFARERDILARLRHPHIARLHDAGVDERGQPWLALDYIEGAPITQWCDTRRLGLRERLVLFGQVLDAVQFAHANLVIHRDLKPSNILVDEAGQISLLDFGIAKLLDDTGGSIAETALTAAGGRLLTVQYASPEQIRGEALTTATDIYSLGVVLYELITGARPYRIAFESAAQLEQA